MGGTEEYVICDALKSGQLFKPLVAWCIGTCANMFTSEVQFGHAGASANSERETAVAKNKVSEYLHMYIHTPGVCVHVRACMRVCVCAHTNTHTHYSMYILLHVIQALREAGAYVPDSFDTLGAMIG